MQLDFDPWKEFLINCHCCVDYVCEGVDLSGVEVIETDRRFIKQARKDIEMQAQKMLEQGMETQVVLSWTRNGVYVCFVCMQL